MIKMMKKENLFYIKKTCATTKFQWLYNIEVMVAIKYVFSYMNKYEYFFAHMHIYCVCILLFIQHYSIILIFYIFI